MVKFELRKPIKTKESKIEVDPGLSPGTYQFSLVVIDEEGNESRPDVLTIQIRPDRGRGPNIAGPNIRGPNADRPNIRRPNA